MNVLLYSHTCIKVFTFKTNCVSCLLKTLVFFFTVTFEIHFEIHLANTWTELSNPNQTETELMPLIMKTGQMRIKKLGSSRTS